MSPLTVSKLAEEAGTSADTVRYYERIGLLPEAERSAAGYRLYDGEAVERLRFIKRAQRFGLRLEAIAELLDVRQRGLCPCGHTRRLLEDRVAELDGELACAVLSGRDFGPWAKEAWPALSDAVLAAHARPNR